MTQQQSLFRLLSKLLSEPLGGGGLRITINIFSRDYTRFPMCRLPSSLACGRSTKRKFSPKDGEPSNRKNISGSKTQRPRPCHNKPSHVFTSSTKTKGKLGSRRPDPTLIRSPLYKNRFVLSKDHPALPSLFKPSREPRASTELQPLPSKEHEPRLKLLTLSPAFLALSEEPLIHRAQKLTFE